MLVMVVNVGIGNSRVIVFDVNGEIICQRREPLQTHIRGSFSEQDPSSIVFQVKKLIKECVVELGSLAQDIEFLTFTTSASCLVAVDRALNPLSICMIVSDSRSVEQARYVEQLVEFQDLKKYGFKSTPDLMLPKILWLFENSIVEPKQVYKFCNIGDFLLAQACRQVVTDPYNATKFYYLIEKKDYPNRLYDAANVPSSVFPDVVNPGCEVGLVCPAFCEDTGLPGHVKCVVTTYDAICSIWGSGAIDAGDAVDIAGTVTNFRVLSDRRIRDRQERVLTLQHHQERIWMIGGSTNLGGGLIEWLRGLFYQGDVDAYARMESDALRVGPCPDGLIFLPHLMGERMPLWDAELRGVFFGLDRGHGRAEFTRAVLESCAFSSYQAMDALKDLGVQFKSVKVSGGVSRISFINQMKSDLFALPVEELSSFETTAIGAAMMVFVEQKIATDYRSAAERFCKVRRVYYPQEDKTELYRSYFELYSKLCKEMAHFQHERARLVRRFENHSIQGFHGSL